jgi:hypothetical protein
MIYALLQNFFLIRTHFMIGLATGFHRNERYHLLSVTTCESTMKGSTSNTLLRYIDDIGTFFFRTYGQRIECTV